MVKNWKKCEVLKRKRKELKSQRKELKIKCEEMKIVHDELISNEFQIYILGRFKSG